MSKKIAAITIGQAPRDDIIPDLKKLIGAETSIEVRGILDKLEMEEIKNLLPKDEEEILKTRLRNGTSVTLGYNSVVKGIKKCLSVLRAEKYEIIALLCTGDFPELEEEEGLVHTSKLLKEEVKKRIKKGILGILIPSSEQILQTERKWKRRGIILTIASASPYGEKEKVFSAVESLAKSKAELIVLDCIGYSLSIYKKLKKTTTIPLLLPLKLLARSISSFF
ncbi:MAG: AroM family protein [Candidatus Aminicenantaceae bacterium]